MDHRIALRLLYVLLFACFVGFVAIQPVAQWISGSFGPWMMIGALAAYAALTVGVIGLINRISSKYYTIEPEPSTPPNMAETAAILSYMKQDQLSQKSLPIETTTGLAKPPDNKG